MESFDIEALSAGHGSVRTYAEEIVALLDGAPSRCGNPDCVECLEWVARALDRSFRRQVQSEEDAWTRLNGSADPAVRASIEEFTGEHRRLRRRLDDVCETLGDPRIPFTPDVRAIVRWVVDDLIDHLRSEMRTFETAMAR
jgi:hypothetical protein